jgi:hypothetical protein
MAVQFFGIYHLVALIALAIVALIPLSRSERWAWIVMELFYRSIWFIAVMLPLLLTRQFPDYAIPIAIILATYIIGDIIAIPFPHVFKKEQRLNTDLWLVAGSGTYHYLPLCV